MHLGFACAKQSCGSKTEKFVKGITNGAQWYAVNGGMQDWIYLHTNCLDISIEVSCRKFPFESELAQHWKEHKEALIAYIEQIHLGVKGFVSDSNGKPIER